jgi:hypothetical protein
MAERANPTISAPSATVTTRPAAEKPSRNGAAMSTKPHVISSAACVGREINRRAVISDSHIG